MQATQSDRAALMVATEFVVTIGILDEGVDDGQYATFPGSVVMRAMGTFS